MLETDRPQFAQAITALASSFRSETDEALLEGYWWALDDLELVAVQRAIRAAMRQCKFMPAAVELRELAGGMSPASRAIVAWEKFAGAVSRHGAYETITFDDHAINATIRNLGGWIKVCDLPGDEFDKWLRKDFERVYQAYLQTGTSAEAGAPLLGIFDQENGRQGYDQREPVVVLTGLPKMQNQIEYVPREHRQIADQRGGELKSIGNIIEGS